MEEFLCLKNYKPTILEKKSFRVGAYCRVSTDKEDQANSFESQQRYFREYITRRPDWELVEIFADEGTSGTSTKKRKAFNRMIAAAKAGELDLLITKEISRFARNTLDSIYYTRELKRHGVGVIFLNDNINTLEPDAELRLTIMSSIAQEESRKTSDRVKWGQKRRMEQGVVFGRDMLGFDVRGGELFINEEGAKIVRLIFDKFVTEGKGTHVIARELREAGIKSYNQNKEWSNTAILRLLRNEKYCGDLVQKKTYTPDYLSHDKKYNQGQEDFVIIKDHHEPIVSREIFEEAARILESRALSQEGKAKHSNRYCFSGKIKCGICGKSYVARYKTRKDGSQYKAWRCYESARNGKQKTDNFGNEIGCSSGSIGNEDVLYIMQLVVNSLKFDREIVFGNLLSAIRQVVMQTGGTIDIEKLNAQISGIKEKQSRLLDIYMSSDIDKSEFIAARDKCDAEIEEIESLIESVKKQDFIIQNQQTLLHDIEEALEEMLTGCNDDDDFYRNILNQMVVLSRDRVDVYLNLLPFHWSYAIEKAAGTDGGKKRSISYHYIGQDQPVHFEEKEEKRSISSHNIGTEELGHLEMIGTIVHQLTRSLSDEQIKAGGFDAYFVNHTNGVYPSDSSGSPFTAAYLQVKGDPITDIHEDMAAEQKARTTYDNILRLIDDPDIREPIKFLREREVVHYQRFGEALRIITDQLDSKNFYAFNPAFDKMK